MACRAQGVYFTLDAIYAIQEYGEGFHRLTDVSLWASVDHSMGTVCAAQDAEAYDGFCV